MIYSPSSSSSSSNMTHSSSKPSSNVTQSPYLSVAAGGAAEVVDTRRRPDLGPRGVTLTHFPTGALPPRTLPLLVVQVSLKALLGGPAADEVSLDLTHSAVRGASAGAGLQGDVERATVEGLPAAAAWTTTANLINT